MPFPILDGCAGAAFSLSSGPTSDIEFQHPHGRVSLRQSAPYVTVSLTELTKSESLKDTAWRIVQESLDVLAATGHAALTTSAGDTAHLLWELGKDGYDLTVVHTDEFLWAVNATVDTATTKESAQPPPYTHHESLRFFRISRCTTDLFDAYRNAYLALECLVSAESRKKRHESELHWLKRVIGGPLSEGVPGGMDHDELLENIYRCGRNPLFHAKLGETFYPPHGEMREEIQTLFQQLTLLLVALIQFKFGNHAIRRWASMSQNLDDQVNRASYDFDEVQFLTAQGSVSARPAIDIVTDTRRFGQLWAKGTVLRPNEIDRLHRVQFLRQGQQWILIEQEEEIPISNVRRIVFEINTANRNIHAPRAFHDA